MDEIREKNVYIDIEPHYKICEVTTVCKMI